MLDPVSAIIEIVQFMNGLMSIYKNIAAAVKRENRAAFFKKLDTSTEMLARASESNLPLEEKRKIRREALDLNADLWGSIAD